MSFAFRGQLIPFQKTIGREFELCKIGRSLLIYASEITVVSAIYEAFVLKCDVFFYCEIYFVSSFCVHFWYLEASECEEVSLKNSKVVNRYFGKLFVFAGLLIYFLQVKITTGF